MRNDYFNNILLTEALNDNTCFVIRNMFLVFSLYIYFVYLFPEKFLKKKFSFCFFLE